MAQVYPLSGAFMAIALMGLIFSGIMFTSTGSEGAEIEQERGYNPGKTWSFTLMFLFALLFVASLIAMTFGPEESL